MYNDTDEVEEQGCYNFSQWVLECQHVVEQNVWEHGTHCSHVVQYILQNKILTKNEINEFITWTNPCQHITLQL